MKIILGLCAILCFSGLVACSDDDNHAKKEKLVNSENTGHMAEKLKGTVMEGQGRALDKAHDISNVLQKEQEDRQKKMEEEGI